MEPARRAFLITSLALLSPVPALARTTGGRQPIPAGYIRVGIEQGVPPAVLFGVALQESRRLFRADTGARHLPWPWTLNVAGTPRRFDSRAAAEAELRQKLRQGIRRIDIGPMQVCWKYHSERLVSEHRALDPYWNLRVGAAILRDHYVDAGDWFDAVGRYHAPAHPRRAHAYASAVYRHIAGLRHA